MTAASDPETERMISPGVDGMCLPVAETEGPAGSDRQKIFLRALIGFMVIGHLLGAVDHGLYGWYLRRAGEAHVMGAVMGPELVPLARTPTVWGQ
jgi:hypothetical protein